MAPLNDPFPRDDSFASLASREDGEKTSISAVFTSVKYAPLVDVVNNDNGEGSAVSHQDAIVSKRLDTTKKNDNEKQEQEQVRVDSSQALDEKLRMAHQKLFARRRNSPPPPKLVRKVQRSWLIPSDHPFKLTWDCLTIILSFLSTYHTHQSIRDRSFGQSPIMLFCEVWFFVDIILNFVTQHKTTSGHVLKDGKQVWARYLTTWFAIDVLSLFPWEMLYVKPIIEMQNKRGFFKKSFFRTKAVIRVTRVLRGRHFKLFGKVARHTKVHAGVGARRLLRLLIKYVPKYLLFVRNMKGVLAVRALRQVRWIREFVKNVFWTKRVDEDNSEVVAKDGGGDTLTTTTASVENDDDDYRDNEWVRDDKVGLDIYEDYFNDDPF